MRALARENFGVWDGFYVKFRKTSFSKAFLRRVAMEFRLNSGFFILSFCRSVKESIKESAFERRQELPAGTGAAPLCQPLKCGADYRDATATLKMKHSRRLWGDRRTFSAVAVIFRRSRRRERGLYLKFVLLQSQKFKLSCLNPLNIILFLLFLMACH